MPAGTKEHLAAEAKRLRYEPILTRAIDEMKMDAMERLAKADPDNKTAFMAAQADYRAADELLTVLERFITAASDEADESEGSPSVA